MSNTFSRAIARVRRRLSLPEDQAPKRFLVLPSSTEANPPKPDVLEDFRLFAVVKTWMDEDIIAATVRNAFAQGADSVFVVDNASTDATVEQASEAGAQIADVYDYQPFDETLSQVLVNSVVAHESLRAEADYVWWLYLDADEFVEGPEGMSVREYLGTLDRKFRIVGATTFNHLPDTKPEYVPGFHPIDFQPLYYPFTPSWEWCGHWKHPLQRFDRGGPFIQCNGGAHDARGGIKGGRSEPLGGVLMHHFQYRDEAVTRAKLQLVCGPGTERGSLLRSKNVSNFDVRNRSLDAVYAQRWGEVENKSKDGTLSGELRRWEHLDQVRRWYSLADLEAARATSGS
jgi:Glycosyl transferase family 2